MAVRRSIPSDALRQFDRLAFVTRSPARAGAGGDHPARRPSPSTDFVDYRPYHQGDDFRRVDWNVYGRLGSLQVKVTEGRERLDVVVVLDCSSSMAFGKPDKLEFGVQLTAALAYVAMGRADSARVACLGSPAQGHGPFARRSQTPELVQLLSQVAPAGLVDVNAGLAGCLPQRPGSVPLVVIVSDLLSPDGAARGLESLQVRQADVAVVHVVSPDELEPRLTGELSLVDAESGETLELGVSLETLAAYRSRFKAWLDARASDCRTRGMRYARVRTDRPLSAVVLDDLRRAGLLR
jgi:uncharacterized protein (DUF58 family)